MKKLFVNYILYGLPLIVLMAACTGMNDIHQKYIDRGEIVYAAMPDTAWSAAGNNRVEVFMEFRSQRVASVRIYWNDFADSIDMDINRKGLFSQLIPNIDEGETLIYLMSRDMYGNISLLYEVVATIYGDIYASRLVNRSIKSIEFNSQDELEITWKEPAEGVVETVLNYQDSRGAAANLIVPATQNVTTIMDFLPESPYSFATKYLPEENAIDLFTTEATEGVFPPNI